ncbi:hypothetical protein ACPCXD_07700 [Rhodococcus sp. AB351]|uniref:hypothetical protein n=1 Tax=Rhodococcus sp. AB351 TaxID=3413280 RepID=UPI003C29A892
MTDPASNENATLLDEVNRRRELVTTSPSFASGQHLQALNRASAVFSGNLIELSSHVQKFVGTEEMPGSLGDEYETDLTRTFHNFLASAATLRDVQRMVHKKLWPEKPPKDPNKKKKSGEPKKTIWELGVWDPKIEEIYGKDEFKFLLDLRNYAVHYTLPVPLTSTEIKWEKGGPIFHRNDLYLNKETLLKSDSWTERSKTYLDSQPDRIDFLSIVEDYSQSVRKFYQWFWDTVNEHLSPGIEDVKSAGREVDLWDDEELAFRDWKIAHFPPPPGLSHDPLSELRRKLAGARRDRWEYGSKGWRVFSVSADRTIEPNGEDLWGLTLRSRSARSSKVVSEL